MSAAIKIKQLKIIELNTNSLISKTRRYNLNTFLNTHRPHIMLLCETKIRECHLLNFRNYNFIRSDKKGTKSGTGILIKNNIEMKTINTLDWNLQYIECTAIKILTNNKDILVVSLYKSPSVTADMTSDLDKILNEAQQLGNCSVIIGGDFNSHHQYWGNKACCSSGKKLYEWLSNNMHKVQLECTMDPTFYRGAYSSFLDIFIISVDLNINYDVCLNSKLKICDYESDHKAVVLEVNLSGQLQQKLPTTVKDYNSTNWQMFRDKITEKINTLGSYEHVNLTPSEINSEIEKLNQIITSTIESQVPTITINHDNQLHLPILTQNLIKEKNRLRRVWQRKKYDCNQHALKADIRNITKIIQDQIKLHHQNHWIKTLQKVKLDNHTFQNINKLTGRNAKNSVPAIINEETGIRTEDDSDKANLIGSYFEKIHDSNQHLGDAIFNSLVDNEIINKIHCNFTPRVQFSISNTADPTNYFTSRNHLISIPHLKSIIKSRMNKKSQGLDKIPNIIIKKLPSSFTRKFAILLNQCFNIAYFPEVWKSATIVPIIKQSKDASLISSYRPIALTSCLGKIYECAIKEKLEEVCTDNKLLPDDQFGFRPGHATTHALVKLKTDVAQKIMQRTPTIMCALDIEKAFDTTWIEGLVYKMKNIHKFDNHLCRLIYNYLKGRTFRVKINNSYSNWFNISAGVPQGGVLSAVLYIIYLADMPSPPVCMNPIKRLQFADDMLIYISVKNIQDGQERMNNYLKTMDEFHSTWKIKTNTQKCEAMVIKGTNAMHSANVRRTCKNIKIVINGNQVPLVKSIKYLGVIISSNLQHIRHVDFIIKKANKVFFAIVPILKKVNGLDPKIKLLCYKQLIRPILCYSFASWSTISSHQMERLRLLERKCLRACINYRRPRNQFIHISNKKLYEKANIVRIDKYMVEQAIRQLVNINKEITPLLEDVLHIDPNINRLAEDNYRTPWFIVNEKENDALNENHALTIYHRRRYHRERNNNTVYNIGQ